MACSSCCACTASFTFLMFLNCLSRSRAQIPPGTVCRRCFLTEHPRWIRVPRVLCSCFLLCTQERPRPPLTAATEPRAGSSPEGSRALLGRRGHFFNTLKIQFKDQNCQKEPRMPGTHLRRAVRLGLPLSQKLSYLEKTQRVAPCVSRHGHCSRGHRGHERPVPPLRSPRINPKPSSFTLSVSTQGVAGARACLRVARPPWDRS